MNFLKRDLKDEAKIKRKKLLEEERKRRIFDPKTRIFGVDTEAWEKQLLEKRQKAEQAWHQEQEYTRRKLLEEQRVLEKEREVTKARKEVEQDIIAFRHLHQRPQSRREFDINDPDACKREVYSQNGVSKFDGEDESCRKRMQCQKEENKAWLCQQMAEKKKLQQAKQTAEERMIAAQLALDRRACEIADLEEKCRRQLHLSTAEFNQLQAARQAAINREKAQKDNLTEAQEIENWMKGDWLTENPRASTSALGPQRVIPYMYKGQPYGELLSTKQQQLQQAYHNKMNQNAQDEEKRKWEQIGLSNAQKANMKVQEMVKEQKGLDKRILEVNARLAQEQKTREVLNNDVSDLKPTPKFFDQFNRTSY